MGIFARLFRRQSKTLEQLREEEEILRREIKQGIGDSLTLRGIAAGLTGPELAEAVRKEKEEVRNAVRNEAEASRRWDEAIALAERGSTAKAVELFRQVIPIKPDYYISVIQPRSTAARRCWQQAVDQYVRDAGAATAASGENPRACSVCHAEIGQNWHYDFESIVFSATLAAQCPGCGATTCDKDLVFAPDGNYKPCARCGLRLYLLSEGPAYSSMVDQARNERRYRGAIEEPSKLGRTVKIG